MDPLPPRVQQELNTSGDKIQTLRGEIREAELEAQKKRLVDTFYKEVNRAYGLRSDSIDYDQHRIDDDGKCSTGRLATKDIDYYDEGRCPVPGIIKLASR